MPAQKKSSSKKKSSSAKKAVKKTSKVKEKNPRGHEYRAEDITVLEGLEPVRKRPGMYIGTTGPDGLHDMLREVFDNSRDEAMGAFADTVEIALMPRGGVRVVDNGRGIPVDKHKQTKLSALETIMTTLHAGGKFGGDGYKISSGLHGVGVSVVNALSRYTKAVVHRDGAEFMQEYERGKPKGKLKKIGASKQTGTVMYFEPDPEIFPDISFYWKRIVDHMRQQAYLVKGLKIIVLDAREHEGDISHVEKDSFFLEGKVEVPSMTFYFDGGLRSMVQFYNHFQKSIHKNIFYTEKEMEGGESVEIAVQYVDDISARIMPFANNIYNAEGGTHITGFKTALTRTLNSYAKKNNLIKEKDGALTGDDIIEGLTAVVSVKLREVQFEGQTKKKLGSVEARSYVDNVFSDAFSAFLEEHPDDAKAMINKVQLAMKARKAAKAAKDSVLRKGALEGTTLPGKLADCSSRKAEDTELFVVEGDSAGGTAKTGRDRRTQAILPLRGKILNIERARIDRALASEQVKNLVIALGTAIGDTFDISKLRYHKIIMATDADVDGAHIRTLLLTLFYRYFRDLIDGGYIYIAQPPLYKITHGKQIHYVFTDAEKEKIVGPDVAYEERGSETETEMSEDTEEAETTTKRKPKYSIQRYKGLGEMDSDELWETTMNPETRVLKQVTVEDAKEADRIFDVLMGKDVPARKSFIQSGAREATLDI